MSGPAALRLAIVNQSDEGGATAAAKEVLAWGPGRGIEARYWPERAGDGVRALLDGLAGFGPHVVHVHCWYRDYPFGLLADLAGRYPVALTVHDVAIVNQYGPECWECWRNPWCLGCPALGGLRRWRPNYRVLSRWRKRRIGRRVRAHLIFPSEWMRRRLARSEWSRLAGTVIPYGIDASFFAGGRRRREAFGLPEGPVVLFAGNMYSPEDHRKGLPDLLAAVAKLQGGEVAVSLAVAGRVTGVAAAPGVHLLGELPRAALPDLYASADVFCMPSRGDNLPVAVLEAMAAGLPVVGTRVGGIPEEVVDGETGLLVGAGRPDELAGALGGLLGDPLRRQAFGRAGQARAAALFSRPVSAARHEALYRQLAAAAV